MTNRDCWDKTKWSLNRGGLVVTITRAGFTVCVLAVLDMHQEIDGLLEQEKAKTKSSLGTTKKGIGPTYAAKSERIGLRVCDLYSEVDVLREK